MKQGIHPEFKTIEVVCACGNTFETKSTVDSIHLDICSVCHPFYTGKQRLVDTAGRVDRFKRKYGDMKSEARQEAEAEAAEDEAPAEEAEAAEAAAETEEPEAPEASAEADEAEGSEADDEAEKSEE